MENGAGVLLGTIEGEIAALSRKMHELARRKAALQDAATALRLGEDEEVVKARLRAD